METVHLIGAEQVQRAAGPMQSAADSIHDSALLILEAVNRLGRMLDEHATRIEAAVQAKADGKAA